MPLSLFDQQANSIQIQTDRVEFLPGETITGQVVFSVVKPIEIDALYITLGGFERVPTEMDRPSGSAVYNLGRAAVKALSDRSIEKYRFFHTSHCLFAPKGLVQAGSHVFPFQLPLDINLPGTVVLFHQAEPALDSGEETDHKFGLYYLLQAQVSRKGLFDSDLEQTYRILVRQHPPQRVEPMTEQTEGEATFFCCISKGAVSVTAHVDRNACGRGEKLLVQVNVDNTRSSVDLEWVDARLARTMTTDGKAAFSYDDTIMATSRAPGLAAGERADRHIILHVPDDIQPSVKSKQIDYFYNLRVVVHLPWSIPLLVELPIHVYAPLRILGMAPLHPPMIVQPSSGIASAMVETTTTTTTSTANQES